VKGKKRYFLKNRGVTFNSPQALRATCPIQFSVRRFAFALQKDLKVELQEEAEQVISSRGVCLEENPEIFIQISIF